MLNVSAVPILTITHRNNFMQVVPVKRWIRNWNCCTFLLEVSIIFTLVTNFLSFDIGSQEKREGNLVDNIYTPSNRHCDGSSQPTGHDCVHRRHLRSFHPVFDPDYTDVVRPIKARRHER